MAEKKMINIRLDPAVWARAKAAASTRGMTLEHWVTEALETQITHQAAGAPGALGSGSELTWRVAALEEAVDYLASAIGVAFPTSNEAQAAPRGLASLQNTRHE